MRKTISTLALTLGVVFAAVPFAGAASTASATDCAAGQSVDANGCYPTPACRTASDVSAELAVVQDRLSRVSAVSQHRLTKIHKQARLIRHLRAQLAKARG